MHIFLSLQKCWSEENRQERLTPPNADKLQEVLHMITQAGHQVYVSLNAGIPHTRTDPCEQDQLQEFEKFISTCVGGGQSGALVDSGLGFWTEHRKLWCEEEGFSITSPDNEKILACVLDRYIMRQKLMLCMTVNKDFRTLLDDAKILPIGLKFLDTVWPMDNQAFPEQDQFKDLDDEAPPSEIEETPWWEEITNVQEIIAKANLAESYELAAVGQKRFWVPQEPWNSWYPSFPLVLGQDRCRKSAECLFCCGKFTKEQIPRVISSPSTRLQLLAC